MEGRDGELDNGDRDLLVFGGEGRVCANGVDVREDDVGAGGVLFEMVVFAVEAERDGVVGVEGFDDVVCCFWRGEGIYLAVF